MPRIGILAIQHESNTFLDHPTTWESFIADVLVEGQAMRDRFASSPHEIGGFYEGLDQAGIEAVGLLAARATPSGKITADTEARLLEAVRKSLASSIPLDGLLVAPHGAAVGETHADFDGHWLNLVRRTVGPQLPIVCTLDLHANVSPSMISSCHATVAYHTNPHLDQRERGVEAAKLLIGQIQGKWSLRQTAALLPMAVGIERQNTDESPCRELFALARQLQQRPGIMAVSPVLGFPYADVAEMGSSVIVVAEADLDTARHTCREIYQYWWDHRTEFASRGIGIAESLDRAAAMRGPVGLLDMGDNVGGGAPGDGTLIAHEVVKRHGPPTLVCLWDPEVARCAHLAGVGAAFENWKVGGKRDGRHGPPLTISGTIQALTDGRFREQGTTHGGKVQYDMGPTAVLQTNVGLTVVAHTHRTPPFSSGQVSSLDIPLEPFQCLVLKGVQAPMAGYRAICREFIRVNTPGVTTADIRQLPYSSARAGSPLEAVHSDPAWVVGPE